jgi:hypothetical protein
LKEMTSTLESVVRESVGFFEKHIPGTGG